MHVLFGKGEVKIRQIFISRMSPVLMIKEGDRALASIIAAAFSDLLEFDETNRVTSFDEGRGDVEEFLWALGRPVASDVEAVDKDEALAPIGHVQVRVHELGRGEDSAIDIEWNER